MYLTKERTPNTHHMAKDTCALDYLTSTHETKKTESNPSELGCCARYSLIKIYGLSFPAKIRWNCVHSFRQRPTLLFRHLRTIPFHLSPRASDTKCRFVYMLLLLLLLVVLFGADRNVCWLLPWWKWFRCGNGSMHINLKVYVYFATGIE